MNLPIASPLALALGLAALGCGSEPPPKPAARPAKPTIATVRAAQDENLMELAVQVAWFYAAGGRLPESLEELAAMQRPAGWPPAPTVTSRGAAVAYRRAGPHQFHLVLAGADGKPDTADDRPIPYEIPQPVPQGLTPDAFRIWWQAQEQKGQLDAIRDATREMLRPGLR
jgi:hypothetical protein